MTELQGLHAVVTGGGSGIGAAVAARLLAGGARVTLMGRSIEKLQAQQARLGGDVAVQTVDIGDEASVKAAFAAVGPVDILVNNAGQVETAPLHRTSLALWQQLLNVNLTGTFLCSREVMAGMSERGFGRIINVASTAALKGYAYVAAYCAAKHGVLGLTRAMALELARKGVTVNAVCPGYTETDIVAQAVATISEKTGRSAEAARAELAAANPQGRLVQPEEVAASVLWLARRDSAAITGQAIAVCGGEVM
ncbi:SDR family NAD(P)-dependent oxidoreductase [Paucibacter sp. M5-1]|uniref:SDR family NAD(P)-dependent oxidoreductase n=1 Tax=Paucibacter sp. M5-1 TaxID=3015998 RepID=UPI0022B90BC2|nr:SDR family NAD(P)-dependent oxidoreductase [Paucibacter sp. M5-1]MCZ7883762.1 SDR family NAD(P)-dependent oxidoreductase [Paucibacter sp. M5-1]